MEHLVLREKKLESIGQLNILKSGLKFNLMDPM